MFGKAIVLASKETVQEWQNFFQAKATTYFHTFPNYEVKEGIPFITLGKEVGTYVPLVLPLTFAGRGAPVMIGVITPQFIDNILLGDAAFGGWVGFLPTFSKYFQKWIVQNKDNMGKRYSTDWHSNLYINTNLLYFLTAFLALFH